MPRVWALSAHHPVAGITPIRFTTLPDDDLSDVTRLTLMADGKVVGTDTEAPWGIDWDTRGFDGYVLLSTRATTPHGSRTTTNNYSFRVDNKAPTGLSVRFPQRDGYIGEGGELVVDATDDFYVIGSELVVGGRVVSSKDLSNGGNLDLRWDAKIPDGKTQMTVRVRDTAGNVTALTRSVTVDNNRPTITGITSAGKAVRGSFTVTLNGYRDASPFAAFQASLSTPTHLRWYGQENSRTVTIDSRDVPEGRYTLGWHAYDAAGNETVVKRALIVDRRAPAVAIVAAPKNRAKVRKTFKVKAKASDPNGIARVQLLVNGRVVKTDTKAGYSFTVKPPKHGKKFTVRVRAYDQAGNVKYSASRTYRR